MASVLKLKSKSKVNIGLRIINKRKDGFHNIHTVFQELDFHDILTISKLSSGCSFSSNVDWLDDSSDNLCIKAYNLMNENYDIGGISISLNKMIPPGSGLGGGSSNAASIIKAINELYELKASYSDLEKISSQIGADVPFFIRGGVQLGEGLGTKLTQIKKEINGFFMLVIPDFQINTSWAYSKSKILLEKPSKAVNFKYQMEKKHIPFELFENDFESIICPSYPEIGVIKDELRAYNACYTSLSGSGSTVYAIFNDKADAKSAELQLSKSHITFITTP
jgi:4-diphosphocytidyl-2-C-methyl-D-erythritol kinase